jgi:FkbM family methyltransferase
MINKFALSLFNLFAGKKGFQPIFEKLYKLSLYGMNMGGGTDTANSGEQSALEYIRESTRAADQLMVFDVGANVGHYANLLYTVFGDRAYIHSFEPSQKTFSALEQNTNKLSKLSRHRFGFGETNGRLRLFTNADGSGLASVYQRELGHIGIQLDKSEEIAIKSIDEFCTENNIDHIHLLKIDVEGHEISVLKGATRMLKAGAIDFIQFEFGGCNIDSRTYFRDFYLLLEQDYVIYRIVRDGLYRVERYKEMYEAFITTNYLAEKRTGK